MDQLAQKHNQNSNQRQGGLGQAPEQINITVLCSLDTGELEFNQKCWPNIQFKDFVTFLQQTVFAQQMESNYEKNIDYTIGRQMITGSDPRTLSELGVKDGDTIKMKLKLKFEDRQYKIMKETPEGMIFVIISCIHETGELEVIQECDPNTPFRELIPLLLDNVFTHLIESQYERKIDFSIGGNMISPYETKTLNQLGVQNLRLIKMKLKLRSQRP